MKYIGFIQYHDSRTGEKWSSNEYCYADSLDQAKSIFLERIKYGTGTELIAVEESK